MIRECNPPKVFVKGEREKKAVGVAPKTLKAVLWCLDEHGRGTECFPSEDRIAQMTGLGLRTVARAIQGLEQLSLICVERRKVAHMKTQNHYRLVWSEIELLCQPGRRRAIASDLATRQPATRPGVATRPPDSGSDHAGAGYSPRDQSAVAADQSAVAADQSAVAACEPPSKRSRSAYPPPPIASASFTGTAWATAAAELCALKVASWRAVLDCAAARGLDEEDLLEQIAIGQATVALPANAKRFHAPLGALAFFLREGRWPCEDVVTPDEQHELDEQQQLVRRRQRAELHRKQAQALAAKEQAAALERDFGPVLDAMDPSERDCLAAGCLDEFLLARFRTGHTALLRHRLLEELAKLSQEK